MHKWHTVAGVSANVSLPCCYCCYCDLCKGTDFTTHIVIVKRNVRPARKTDVQVAHHGGGVSHGTVLER